MSITVLNTHKLFGYLVKQGLGGRLVYLNEAPVDHGLEPNGHVVLEAEKAEGPEGPEGPEGGGTETGRFVVVLAAPR